MTNYDVYMILRKNETMCELIGEIDKLFITITDDVDVQPNKLLQFGLNCGELKGMINNMLLAGSIDCEYHFIAVNMLVQKVINVIDVIMLDRYLHS